MNFNEAMLYLKSTEVFGSKLGLSNITRLMELLGNPHKRPCIIHVAGTNGKGSVSSFIGSILTEAGYRTGLFTSPHIERFNERIVLDGEEITDEDAARALSEVKQKIDMMLEQGLSQPTEFEIVTAAAFVYFCDKECDFAVMEVGLGGRLDATNVIDVPEAAVITSISYDHTAILGNTLSQIAYEKAGIIKRNGIAVTCSQHPDAYETLEAVCNERSARLYTSEEVNLISRSLDCQIFDCGGYSGLKITLLGGHQLKNAALAVKALDVLIEKGWEIPEKAIRDGLFKAKWPGRFELIRKTPPVVLDGAHNPQGASALSKALSDYFGDKKILFIMGILADKSYEEILDAVVPIASRFYTVTPNSGRALSAKTLSEIIRRRDMSAECCETVYDAINKALDTVLEDEVICCFGSLYIIGEARDVFTCHMKGEKNAQA